MKIITLKLVSYLIYTLIAENVEIKFMMSGIHSSPK